MDELPMMKHRILSLLDMRAAARSSLLSRSWQAAWASRPAILLDKDNTMSTVAFAAIVDQSLRRYSAGGSSTESLRITTSFCRRQARDAVGRFAAASSLKELEVTVLSRQIGSCLNLLSSSTLTKLRLCRIQLERQHSHDGDSWEFPRLRSIELRHVSVDSVLPKLLSASPSLELLAVAETLLPCSLNFQPKLKKLKLSHIRNLVSPEIRLEGCGATMEELSITGSSCVADWLRSKISKFRCLRVLELHRVFGPTTLRISSEQLTDLRVTFCPYLGVDSVIDAPNLRHLEYRENQFPTCSLDSPSTTLESVVFDFCLAQAVRHGTVWFDKLSELLASICDLRGNVVVSVICRKPKIVIVQKGLTDALFDTILDLVVDNNSTLLAKVLITSDNKLWARSMVDPFVSPSYIFVSSTSDDDNTLPELLSKNLLPVGEVNEEDPPCCRFGKQRLRSYTKEVGHDLYDFEGDAETRHALLRAYGESTSKYTGFNLHWS